MSNILEVLEEDKKLWIPPYLEAPEPTDGTSEPDEPPLPLNMPTGEVERATEDELWQVLSEHGRGIEPEIGRAAMLRETPEQALAAPVPLSSYLSDYPTRFFFRTDVHRSINRVQQQFKWQTYANTYVWHPPVHKARYEHVSVDYWGGGLRNGRYIGYRGKPIGTELGHRVFRAIFNDPHRPNIYWIIWNGRMWTRGYGWGPSPGGPVGSDALHKLHIHVSYLRAH